MPFQKGQPRPAKAGRKKGTPNKRRTIFESLEEIVTEDGQPIDVVKLFFDGVMTMPPFQRVDALIDFMKFVYPQQKTLEIGNKQGEDGQDTFKVEIVDYTTKK